MKSLNQFILEELDDNLLWMIDKWFELNNDHLQEFIELITKYNDYKFNKKELELELNGYENDPIRLQIKEFINFVDNDLYPEDNKDYIQKLLDIIRLVCDNKSPRNKYTKKGNA